MTNKFASIARWLNVRQQLDQAWVDTIVAPPDTQIMADEVRITAAEAEWFNEWLDDETSRHAQAQAQH